MTWREKIVEARKRGGFSVQERDEASSWRTCAVGEQHELHPDVVVYRTGLEDFPVDRGLQKLGGANGFGGFEMSVKCDNFDEAERFLDLIEDRVLELKRRKH